MTIGPRRASCSWPVVTCIALAGAGPVLAQETTPPGTTPPQTTPGTTPPSDPVDDAPAGQPVGYTGHPREASAGGSERRLPDHAGLFPNSPVSLIAAGAKQVEDWTSENLRFDLGFRAAWFFQQASAGPGERTAAAQDYRIHGTWHLFNWEEDKNGWAGNIYTRFEWRAEMFTKIPPAQLNGEIGTLAPTTYGQDEHDPAVVQLYYEQFLFDGGLRLRVGKIDPDDYFNLGRWADDYRYFDHTLFSAFPAANHPSGGLGWNAQWYITPEWTLTGGMSDVQGRKTLSGFETIDDGKFIYALDVTYSPTIQSLGKGNYRLGIEYRDAVEDKDRPEDTTFYLNIDQEVEKDVAPFLRIGYGTGNSTGVDWAVSAGLGVDNALNRPGDAFGIGIGFDTPDNAIDSDRSAEYVGEIFYRFQLTHALQWTIGGQMILDPINAPDDDVLGIFEMRLVLDF